MVGFARQSLRRAHRVLRSCKNGEIEMTTYQNQQLSALDIEHLSPLFMRKVDQTASLYFGADFRPAKFRLDKPHVQLFPPNHDMLLVSHRCANESNRLETKLQP